jgi:signal transduction histidine kinase
MTEILNEFLSTGKLDEGKMHVSVTQVNIAQFIGEVEQEVSLLKKDKQVFEFLLNSKRETVNTDTQILKNILLNLISNAIKYSRSDGLIIVNVNVSEKDFRVSVIDEGVGIPEEEQKYIFQRFFRAHNVSGTQGTGLGLNIVRKYVKLLQGKIEFNSELNKGSTFTVIFPQEIKT